MSTEIEKALDDLASTDVAGLVKISTTLQQPDCRPLATWLQSAVIDQNSGVMPRSLETVAWSDGQLRAGLEDCSRLLRLCRDNGLENAFQLFNAVTDELLTELHRRGQDDA